MSSGPGVSALLKVSARPSAGPQDRVNCETILLTRLPQWGHSCRHLRAPPQLAGARTAAAPVCSTPTATAPQGPGGTSGTAG